MSAQILRAVLPAGVDSGGAPVKFPLVKFPVMTRWIFAGLLGAMLLAPGYCVRAQQPAQTQTEQSQGSGSTPEAQSPEKNKQEADENEAYRHSPTVRKLGAKLGMNAEQSATAFEVLNFVVLAVLVGWFLVKTLPKAFRDRSSPIQKHLVDARTATEEATARLSSVEERLCKLDEQIAAMQAQAEKDSARDEQRIKASVEEEKNKILAAAEQEIAAATIARAEAVAAVCGGAGDRAGGEQAGGLG